MTSIVTTLDKKIHTYTTFFKDESKTLLLVIGMRGGGEHDSFALHIALADKHSNILVYTESGEPQIYRQNTEEYSHKTIFHVFKDDIELIEGLKKKYGSHVSVAYFS